MSEINPSTDYRLGQSLRNIWIMTYLLFKITKNVNFLDLIWHKNLASCINVSCVTYVLPASLTHVPTSQPWCLFIRFTEIPSTRRQQIYRNARTNFKLMATLAPFFSNIWQLWLSAGKYQRWKWGQRWQLPKKKLKTNKQRKTENKQRKTENKEKRILADNPAVGRLWWGVSPTYLPPPPPLLCTAL